MSNVLGASLIFGAIIFLILPDRIAIINDDFGYLRSVVATIQHHRPWTDDWLEPWAASLSASSALIYGVTGSFYLATYGLLGLLGAAVFFLLVQCLKIRGWDDARSITFSAVWLTIPTCLWKMCEFTSVPLYLACFLAALWSWERKHWGAFALAWIIGLAARQSAIAWAIFPFMGLALELRNPGSLRITRSIIIKITVLMIGAMTFISLLYGMNTTHAQRVITGHLLSRLSLSDLLTAGFTGLGVYVFSTGMAAFVSMSHTGSISARRSIRYAFFGVLLLLLLVYGLPRWVSIEHLLYEGPVGWLFAKALLAASLWGLIFARYSIDWRYAVGALAMISLLCLRGTLWDYYLIEVALLGVLGLKLQPASTATPLPQPRPIRAIRPILFVGLAGLSLACVFQLKFTVDRASAVCQLAERAMRSGKLQPADISFSPFGFIAWHWYPYYIEHEGRELSDIAGFGRYLNQGAVEVGQGYSKFLHLFSRFRHVPPADRTRVIDWGEYRFAWFFRAEYHLVRMPASNAAPAEVLYQKAQPPEFLFPLNDDEWRELIRKRP